MERMCCGEHEGTWVRAEWCACQAGMEEEDNGGNRLTHASIETTGVKPLIYRKIASEDFHLP